MERERGRDVAHLVHTRLLRLGHAPPRIGGQCLKIAPRALGIEYPERERRLARAGHARNADDLIQRNIDGHILQIVHACPAHLDYCRVLSFFHTHSFLPFP